MTKQIQKLSRKISSLGFSGVYLAQYDKGVKSKTFEDLGKLFGTGGFAGKTTFGDLVNLTVQVLLVIAGSVAVIFLILGGYRYITASGNEDQMESAKKTMTGAIVGIIVIILAFAIIAIISNILVAGDVGIK